MKPDLVQLIEKSDSLIDLEGRLNEFGVRFRTLDEYIEYLNKEWKKIVALRDIDALEPLKGNN